MLIINFGKSSHGRSQGVPNIFRTPTHWAHRAVIFATARLSCLLEGFKNGGAEDVGDEVYVEECTCQESTTSDRSCSAL